MKETIKLPDTSRFSALTGSSTTPPTSAPPKRSVLPDDEEIVSFKELRAIGVLLARASVMRKMQKMRERTSGSRMKGTFKSWLEPNADPFPQFIKFGDDRNARIGWRKGDVRDWLHRRRCT